MDKLITFLDSIPKPQITWAVIFTVLGFIGRTIVDLYIKRQQTRSELEIKHNFEQKTKQEVEKMALMGQLSLAIEANARIFHQLLRHAKSEARDQINNPDSSIGYLAAYATSSTVLGLGRLLEYLQSFQSNQFSRILKQLPDGNLLKAIGDFEEVLSKQGVYRDYQIDLSAYILKSSHTELEELIRSRKSLEKKPVFLKQTVTWTNKMIKDFVEAWKHLIQHPSQDDDVIYLEQMLIEMRGIEYSPGGGMSLPDMSSLLLSDDSRELLQVLETLSSELAHAFILLDKGISKKL